MHELQFPALTFCNLGIARKSFFSELDLPGEATHEFKQMMEFIFGPEFEEDGPGETMKLAKILRKLFVIEESFRPDW